MSTPLDRTGAVGTTGKKVVACLSFPSGLSAGTGTTVTGGTVPGTTTISNGATQIFVGMTESPAGSSEYDLNADIGGTLMPDTTTRPYTVDARQVADATDMTTYSAIAAAYAASTTKVITTEPVTYGGGFLKSGGWGGSLPNGNILPTIGTGANQIAVDGTTGGVKLAATGLDAISVADPGVPANWTTFPRIMVAVFRSIFKKSTLTSTGGGAANLQYLADDGTTVNATSAVSDNGTIQSKGAAS